VIKVINDQPAAIVVKQCICKNCGVTLEYTPNDTEIEVRSDYTGDKDRYRMLVCPKCTNRFNVSM